jgi:RNA polymerase sigma-70 factor (ECF subfamily)
MGNQLQYSELHQGGTLAQSGNDGSIHSGMREEVLPVHMAEAEVNDLFASCLPVLRKTTRRMMRNAQDSEDVLQDGLLLAFRKLHQFEGRSSFSTWLHSIVRNCSRIHFRKENAQRVAFVELAPDQDQLLLERGCVETRPSPEELCIQRELSDILRRTTDELPTKYHDAIKCFHLDGLGERETARRLRMTPSALKAQLHRSRRILTSRIRSSYIPESLRTSARYREASRRSSATRMGKHRRSRRLADRKVENTML